MSVQSEINRLKQAVSNAFIAVGNKGGTVPASKVSGNLASAIDSIKTGVELNFDVVCNPQPSSPAENTIWVDTDRINNYYFSATQPENMAEYDVWFRVGIFSDAEFNALKKNGIMVYPISAQQYVNGALVKKDFKIYLDGVWTEQRRMLYYRGDQCVDKTGGWTSSGLKWANGYDAKTATFESDRIILKPDSQVGAAQTENKIDFTGFTKILFLYKNITISNNRAFECSICTGRNLYSDVVSTPDTYDGVSGIEQIAEIPLSSLQGQYYPSVLCGAGRKCEVYEIWLE